jgi:hypothetical protein
METASLIWPGVQARYSEAGWVGLVGVGKSEAVFYGRADVGQPGLFGRKTSMSKDARRKPQQAKRAEKEWSPAVRAKMAELVELVAQEEYGPDGPPLELPFSQIELLGHYTGRCVAQQVDAAVQQRHAQRHYVDEQACPQCGQRCGLDSKTRPLQTLDGEARLSEPACYCNACQRSFFPSASVAETRRPQL